MDSASLLKKLEVPTGAVDVVLDTDAYNAIDDPFAIAYLLRSNDRLKTRAIYAAPFFNFRASSPADGMEKSYQEIINLLALADGEHLANVTFRGSAQYLPDEKTPVDSPAARDLAERAMGYSPESPLYVVAIGAITNIASALLMHPEIANRIVIVWLGGHAWHLPNTAEFNMKQDIAAARVVFGSGAPLVQLPCGGVADHLTVSRADLEMWLLGKNPLADYLAKSTIEATEAYAKGTPWTRAIGDVAAVAWLLNDHNRFMQSTLEHAPLPEYSFHYSFPHQNRPWMRYVYFLSRDRLMTDLFTKLTK